MPRASKRRRQQRINNTPLAGFFNRGDFSYKLGSPIGEGTYAKVLLALEPETGELFAVKKMRIKDLADEKVVASMEREMQILKGLDHKHLVRYVGSQKHENAFEIVLEYCSGNSVSSLINQFGALRESLVRRYAYCIFSGLKYLHMNRVIHGDIKAANCLIAANGDLKLADFGSSKQLRGRVGDTMKDKSMKRLRGSIAFMAPEVARGEGYTTASDIWSAGMTILEMLSGGLEDNSSLSTVYKVATLETPPSPPEGSSKLAVDFMRRSLKVDSVERYSAAKLLSHLFPRDASASAVSSSSRHVCGPFVRDCTSSQIHRCRPNTWLTKHLHRHGTRMNHERSCSGSPNAQKALNSI